ncbi:SDR family NAD(P)-dependent oxidoreductase [Dactylosporangium sp. NPDC051541]|uniref:SDR family NAD(P)-dependent oxidoreductase n=1 Tax=Dactylosporangium sp. NPDC051541 TaxID=3363977 RepID=UPI0037B20FCA
MPRALIVGNTDGIGLALTRRLLDTGWDVVGVSRRPSELDSPAYEHVVADVTAADYARQIGNFGTGGTVDLAVYAAGIGEPLDLANLGEQTDAIRVNLLGAALTADAVLPAMVEAGRGHFVGLSSLADILVTPDAPGYAASKAGLTSYLLSLGKAVRKHGVAVTAVRFGFVDTKMAKSPVAPFKISVDEAVDVLVRVIANKPSLISYPRKMALAARALRTFSRP